VLGLEVVLPTGEIVSLGGKRAKDVTGYDLKQLVVGSEGTLGIVTKIFVRLLPLPVARVDLLVPFRDVQSAIDIVPRIMTEARVIPTSVEFMDELSVRTACGYLNEHLACGDAGAVLLIEVDGNDAARLEAEAESVGELCMSGGALEVYVADNATTQERVWGVRRSVPEAFKACSPEQSLEDIVVPVAAIPALMPELGRISRERGVRIPCYGHAADGNMHATLIKDPGMPVEEWYRLERETLKELYGVVRKLGGAISGEHGIGSKRARYMPLVMDPTLIALQRRIKQAFDPLNILNPGKILPPLDAA
jgi:glycolate oxidase